MIDGTEHGEAPITIAFTPTEADHFRAIRDAASRHRAIRWMSIVLLVAPLALIAASMRAGTTLSDAIISNLFWIIFAPLAVFMVGPVSQRAQARYARRRTREATTPWVFTFDDNGARFDASQETPVPWNRVRRVLETKDSMLIYVSAREAAFLPMSAIPNAHTLSALRELFRRHLGDRAEVGGLDGAQR